MGLPQPAAKHHTSLHGDKACVEKNSLINKEQEETPKLMMWKPSLTTYHK